MRAQKGTAIPSPGHPIWQAQIDFTKPHGVPWAASDFAAIKRSGANRVEINLDWGDIEPEKGQYDFRLLDRYLAGTARSGLKLYLIFWEGVWAEQQGKNPPKWLSAREVTSDGLTALQPPWWDKSSREAYFNYVARTIDHVKGHPGFGGLYANYGWLDAMWGPEPKGSRGVTGYAPADIKAFYRWLPQTHPSLASFNARWRTSYKTWRDVPVARPGQRLFPVYQRFRYYSVEQAYNELSRLVREHTNAPMFYYWGGGIGGRGGPAVLGNDPDTFFRLAKRYHATVVLDDVDASGNAVLFGSMARAYRVPLLQEWTPSRKDLRAEIPQWLGHIGLGAPFEVGESFFIYPPPPQRPGWVEAWKAYQQWHATLAEFIRGRSPEQPVAVLVPTLKIALSHDLDAFADLNQELTTFWRHYHVLPHLITDQQVEHGVVSLQQFRAVVDLGNEIATLPALRIYAEKHPVLKTLEQADPYLRPYVKLDPAYDRLEVTPVVRGSSVWLSLANCNGEQAYSGMIHLDPAAVGLGAKESFSVKNAQTGQPVRATRSAAGDIEWRVDLPRAGFEVVRINLANSAAR